MDIVIENNLTALDRRRTVAKYSSVFKYIAAACKIDCW